MWSAVVLVITLYTFLTIIPDRVISTNTKQTCASLYGRYYALHDRRCYYFCLVCTTATYILLYRKGVSTRSTRVVRVCHYMCNNINLQPHRCNIHNARTVITVACIRIACSIICSAPAYVYTYVCITPFQQSQVV